MNRTLVSARRIHGLGLLFVLMTLVSTLLAGVGQRQVQAAVVIGDGGAELLAGQDNDNANNTFLQPSGVTAKQHMDNTDLLLGNNGNDLLIGMLGGDVADGGAGSDITIGGVEGFVAPNSDVLMGGLNNDINIWAPGDGSDLYVGGSGYDTHISAPIVLQDGKPRLFWELGRQIPHVTVANQPSFSCTVERVPATKRLGVQYITRFFVNGNLAVTIRLKDVEQVLCPSPRSGKVMVAALTSDWPTRFVERPLSHFSDTLIGAIIQAP